MLYVTVTVCAPDAKPGTTNTALPLTMFTVCSAPPSTTTVTFPVALGSTSMLTVALSP